MCSEDIILGYYLIIMCKYNFFNKYNTILSQLLIRSIILKRYKRVVKKYLKRLGLMV